MKIYPKIGIDKLLFGMKQKDVEAIYGKANKQFIDEDKNIILVYNDQKWRLTFYEDENFRLGYIICSNNELQLFDMKILNRDIEVVKLEHPVFKSWEKEDFDLAENHFNEDNWIILQTAFGVIANVELGAIINKKDEFEWKFRNN